MLALIFGGVAVICFTSVAAALTPWMVPIRVHIDKRRRGTDGIHVDLCEMDWVTYKKNPTLYPLNPDLLSLSLCVNSSHMALAVPFRVLEAEYIALGCSSSERDDEATVLACEPAGIIQHEARVGSTLAANMLAVLPHTLVYPESTVPFDLLNWHIQSLSAAEEVHVLRVVFAALGRPIHAARRGAWPVRFSGSGMSFKPDRVFLKLQSATATGMKRLLVAFPSVPWVFLHREPVAVLASLLRGGLMGVEGRSPCIPFSTNEDQTLFMSAILIFFVVGTAGAKSVPPADAPASRHLVPGPALLRSPCLRGYPRPRPYVALLLKEARRADPSSGLFSLQFSSSPSPEAICAAEIAQYCDASLEAAKVARAHGLLNALRAANVSISGRLPGIPKTVIANGTEFVSFLRRWGLTSPDLAVTHNDGPTSPSFPVDILPRGVVVSKREGYGSLGGIGQGLIMHYTANFSEAFMSVYAHHFRSTALSQEDVDAMRNIAQAYSKARGGKTVPGKNASAIPSGDIIKFQGDEERKEKYAWEALRLAAETFLRRRYNELMDFEVPSTT